MTRRTERALKHARHRPTDTPKLGKLLWILLPAVAIASAMPFLLGGPRNEPKRHVVDLTVMGVDADGKPIADVQVCFYERGAAHLDSDHECKTGSDGCAVLPAEHANGEFYCIGTTPEGLVTQGFVRQDDAKQPPRLEFAPAEPIEGSVFDQDSKPKSGVRVTAHLANGPALESAATDEKGRFAFRKISSTLPFLSVRVRGRGYADAEKDWDRRARTRLRFKLVRTEPVRVKVLSPDGVARAGIHVRVPGRRDLERRTDESGVVEFEGVHPKDRLYLLVEHPTHTYLNNGFRPMKRGQVLQFEQPATLAGLVRDANGNPVGDVEIRHRHGPRAWVRTRSDWRGRFKIGDLPSGKVELHYEMPAGEEGVVVASIRRGEAQTGFLIRAN